MWLEVLKTKDEVLRHFKKVKATAEVERKCKFAFCSGRGSEFNSDDFVEFFEKHEINRNTIVPYSPQQNRVVERRTKPSWRWHGAS